MKVIKGLRWLYGRACFSGEIKFGLDDFVKVIFIESNKI